MVEILGLCVIVGYLRGSGASFTLLGSIFDRPMFSFFIACHVSLVIFYVDIDFQSSSK